MFSFQKCHLKMDKRSKGKKILFVCERNSAQSPFVSKTYITSQRNFIHSTIQDGGALQPLPGKAKEHDGTKLDMLINVICLAGSCWFLFSMDSLPLQQLLVVGIYSCCWSSFQAFSMGTQVTSPGKKAQDKEKVQEILMVSWQFFYFIKHYANFSFQDNDNAVN